MNNKLIHFVSDFPVFIKINNQSLGDLKSHIDTLSIETNCEPTLLVEIYPINSKNCFESVPYFAELSILSNQIKTNSNFLEITNYDDINFEIKILPMKITLKTTQKVLEKIKVNNDLNIVLFDDGNENVEISTKTSVYHHVLKEKILNPKCEYFQQNNNEFLFLTGKTQKNQDFLVIFNNFFCNLEISADIIETTRNEITVLNYQNDIAKHGIVQKYTLNENEFMLSDEYTVLLEGEALKTQDPKIIPWAFCEAINIKNTKLARFYLDKTLNSMLSDEHLLSFFGDYEEIKWNKYKDLENTICFVYGKEQKISKTFKFEIIEGKITNIISLDWNLF